MPRLVGGCCTAGKAFAKARCGQSLGFRLADEVPWARLEQAPVSIQPYHDEAVPFADVDVWAVPRGGSPGCCLRMGPAKPTGPTSALALPRLGPMVWLAGMCRRVGRHHVPPCWSARGVSEGRYPLPQRICVLLLAGRGWPIVAVERKEPVVVPKGEPRWQRRWCCLVRLGAAGRAPCPCCVWVVGCRGCVCGVLALSLSLSGAQSPISFLIHFSIKTLNPKP